ncbi:hypothetical protein [Natrinema sp. 1APR25-10V2]|uniref:hypothetical protein n=1 Tax=Natrinema sp. 1APR25-10V2 TaxID=2951081 RepID=UPI0028741122|nr:hypothetical protein [Natrinema sp. 1APR25-10V2]MDS0477536.1 hypothetical protein [Natrinema sp. 1APR25-10V2]
MQAGATAASVLALGLPGTAGAQESEDGNDAEDTAFRNVIATRETFFGGAIFRVVSPPLENAPVVENPDVVRNHEVRVVEYFNTNEEGYIFVPPNTQIEQGEVYIFDDLLSDRTQEEIPAPGLIQVEFRPLREQNLPFEYDVDEDFELLEGGGGEAAVRPDDFYSQALFEITSGAQGWVPQDIEQSGLFTDYNTVHARYLGTNQRFLLFAQEAAQTNTGALYVMRDESEIFDPAGNLVAAEFTPVDEESLTFDDDFLR